MTKRTGITLAIIGGVFLLAILGYDVFVGDSSTLVKDYSGTCVIVEDGVHNPTVCQFQTDCGLNPFSISVRVSCPEGSGIDSCVPLKDISEFGHECT